MKDVGFKLFQKIADPMGAKDGPNVTEGSRGKRGENPGEHNQEEILKDAGFELFQKRADPTGTKDSPQQVV